MTAPQVVVCLSLLALAPAFVSAQSSAPRIVVVEGEDAVNIIQQKTAVAPVIEIRDRNNLPVAGVAVTFSVGGQGASFGGLSTLTVTTNAAGQAAAAGLTPTAAGAIQIHATALVQGQALTATITQTNVLTAAQAAGASAAGGLSSAAVIGIVGGAAAIGGGLAVAAGKSSSGSNGTSATPTQPIGISTSGTNPTPPTSPAPPPTSIPAPAPVTLSVSGPVNGTHSARWDTLVGGKPSTCVDNYTISGTIAMTFPPPAAGSPQPTVEFNGSDTPGSFACAPEPVARRNEIAFANGSFRYGGTVSGPAENFRYEIDLSRQVFLDIQTVPPGGLTMNIVGSITISGSLSGNSVSGTVVINERMTPVFSTGLTNAPFVYTANMPFILR